MSGKVVALGGRGLDEKPSSFASTKTFCTKRNKRKLQLKKTQKLTQKKEGFAPSFLLQQFVQSFVKMIKFHFLSMPNVAFCSLFTQPYTKIRYQKVCCVAL